MQFPGFLFKSPNFVQILGKICAAVRLHFLETLKVPTYRDNFSIIKLPPPRYLFPAAAHEDFCFNGLQILEHSFPFGQAVGEGISPNVPKLLITNRII